MENKRLRMVAIALMGIVITSLGVVGLASSLSNRAGTYQTGVFAKVYGYGDWIRHEVVGEWKTLLSMRLPNVPISAYYHVVCDGWSNTHNGELEIAIGVDSATEDESTRRFYSHDDPDLLTGIHTERIYYLGPGSHAFYFLGQKYSGVGDPSVNYHTITVIIFTDGALNELVAEAEGGIAPNDIPR